jgi:hypothetical protein
MPHNSVTVVKMFLPCFDAWEDNRLLTSGVVKLKQVYCMELG